MTLRAKAVLAGLLYSGGCSVRPGVVAAKELRCCYLS